MVGDNKRLFVLEPVYKWKDFCVLRESYLEPVDQQISAAPTKNLTRMRYM